MVSCKAAGMLKSPNKLQHFAYNGIGSHAKGCSGYTTTIIAHDKHLC